jgi:Uma2 family endonuclease
MTYAISSDTASAPPQNPLTFTEFLDWHPEDGRRYELFDGIPVEMTNPTGSHEAIGGFLSLELGIHCRQHHPQWFLPLSATVKPNRDGNGYKPDLIILDKTQLQNEPLWSKRSSILSGASIPLIIEIVSTNWRDDYDRAGCDRKGADYEELGIPEYWLIDHRALAAVRAIGAPKQPTLTVCNLVDNAYELQRFHRGDRILSQSLPNLLLTIDALFDAAGLAD